MTCDDPLDSLRLRLDQARAKRDRCEACGDSDAFQVAMHYVRVLERRLDQCISHARPEAGPATT